MIEINVPREEREAIKAVDVTRLLHLVDQCMREERLSALIELRLEDCGTYVGSKYRVYAQSLADHAAAKAAKKRSMTDHRARSAGSDLVAAIHEMKHRVATEETEDQLFQVEDCVSPPHVLDERINVRVGYRWRRSVDDDWTRGSITFVHDVDMQPDFRMPPPNRKPSAAKQAEARREELYRTWEHLTMLALHAVKRYFRDGGRADAIPRVFLAKLDSHSRGLNNFSANFWPEPTLGG
ncbi:hypothetical protein [Paucibacter sp. KCTC 42545]|uniref:hypothetical protein n=1 Tax=Paucibacter sp. KCTC 42545 TaxID=1768242 RepID=UPI000733B00C|nr:hypothetical protein [Paucibacter sp. KCTC 42545]ALT80032.1 hypothetical protein AT984_19575 [Paucibacter sp. KCTC 42545]